MAELQHGVDVADQLDVPRHVGPGEAQLPRRGDDAPQGVGRSDHDRRRGVGGPDPPPVVQLEGHREVRPQEARHQLGQRGRPVRHARWALPTTGGPRRRLLGRGSRPLLHVCHVGPPYSAPCTCPCIVAHPAPGVPGSRRTPVTDTAQPPVRWLCSVSCGGGRGEGRGRGYGVRVRVRVRIRIRIGGRAPETAPGRCARRAASPPRTPPSPDPRRHRWPPPPPGCRGRRRAHARTSSSAAPPAPAACQRGQAVRGRGHQLVVPLPGVAVVVRDAGQADGPRVPQLGQLATRTPGCRATSTSSRRPCGPSPGASSGARTARRWPPRTARPRTRGAGRSGREPPPCRSMVVPSSRRHSAEHSMCQPGRPGPHSDSHDGSSGAARAATARSPAGRACSGRRRCRPARRRSASICSRS